MENFKLGYIFNYPFSFTQEDVINFANASGDLNPIHLDEDYAKNTIFKKTIIHGFLGGSVFSKIFGTIIPGEGTIYLNQNMFFYKPMYTGVKYYAKITIEEIIKNKSRAIVKTEIFDEQQKLIIDGSAIIQHPQI